MEDEEQEAAPPRPLAVWGEEEGRSWRPGYQAITNSASKHATSSNARSFLCFGKTRAARSLSLTRSCPASGGAQPPVTHKQDSPGAVSVARFLSTEHFEFTFCLEKLPQSLSTEKLFLKTLALYLKARTAMHTNLTLGLILTYVED